VTGRLQKSLDERQGTPWTGRWFMARLQRHTGHISIIDICFVVWFCSKLDFQVAAS
ncbi:hypothetical protein ATANTOWER_015961, partial [Ataeniobius toweri]|nr:hypothetical protein [Ataeniobius toweri]